MVNAQSGPVMQQSKRLFSVGTIAEMSDAELQVRFAERGEDTESAFATAADVTLPPPVIEIVVRTVVRKHTGRGCRREPAGLRPRITCGRLRHPGGHAYACSLRLRGGADRAPAGICARFAGRRAGVRPTVGPAAVDPPRREPPAKLDRLGDPLPPGAVARLGTRRFHDGQTVNCVVTRPTGGSWRRPSIARSRSGTRTAAGSCDAWRRSHLGRASGILARRKEAGLLIPGRDRGPRQIVIHEVATGRESTALP